MNILVNKQNIMIISKMLLFGSYNFHQQKFWNREVEININIDLRSHIQCSA